MRCTLIACRNQTHGQLLSYFVTATVETKSLASAETTSICMLLMQEYRSCKVHTFLRGQYRLSHFQGNGFLLAKGTRLCWQMLLSLHVCKNDQGEKPDAHDERISCLIEGVSERLRSEVVRTVGDRIQHRCVRLHAANRTQKRHKKSSAHHCIPFSVWTLPRLTRSWAGMQCPWSVCQVMAALFPALCGPSCS